MKGCKERSVITGSAIRSKVLLEVNLHGFLGYTKLIITREGGDEVHKHENQIRREQMVSAFYNGIGTAIGITVGGFILTLFVKLIKLM